MRISGLRREQRGSQTRVAADVVWEDSERRATELYFEAPAPFGDDLEPDPHAFLLAAIVPALATGEARVAIEGHVCPRLRDGLLTAMQILGQWSGRSRPPVVLEPSRGFAPRVRPEARTGMLLSGGIDSMATLTANRRDYPREHPGAVRACLFVYGFDLGLPGSPEHWPIYERARAVLAPVAADAGASLVPVSTNLRTLPAEEASWPNEWFGAAAAAVGHAFSRRLSRLLFASSLDIPSLEPVGSHPILDPCFSSDGLEVVHEGAHLTRLEKVRLVTTWRTAFEAIRVCWAGLPPDGPLRADGPLNCGRCRKCVWTMMALLYLGKLGAARTFPFTDVTPDMLDSTQIDDPNLAGFYRQMLPALDAIGRRDLVEVIRGKLDAFERSRRWRADRGFKGALRRFDRRYLGGALQRLAGGR